MGDPDFVKVPVEELTSKAYAKKIYDGIDPKGATPSSEVRPGLEPLKEGTNTTHHCVIASFAIISIGSIYLISSESKPDFLSMESSVQPKITLRASPDNTLRSRIFIFSSRGVLPFFI